MWIMHVVKWLGQDKNEDGLEKEAHIKWFWSETSEEAKSKQREREKLGVAGCLFEVFTLQFLWPEKKNILVPMCVEG